MTLKQLRKAAKKKASLNVKITQEEIFKYVNEATEEFKRELLLRLVVQKVLEQALGTTPNEGDEG